MGFVFMRTFSFYLILSLITPILILLGIIISKMIAGKGLPDSRYNPIDYITGNTTIIFQEQKEEKEKENDQDDDKDKNINKK
jgi:hypothetical protein